MKWLPDDILNITKKRAPLTRTALLISSDKVFSNSHSHPHPNPHPVAGASVKVVFLATEINLIAKDFTVSRVTFFSPVIHDPGHDQTCLKKLKGANLDCGGYKVTLEGFYPGLEKAIQKWIANFGVDFKGLVIIQNCSAGKKYLVGAPFNLITIESIDSTWGEEVDKEKGSKIIFTCKQSVPMAFYEGTVIFDPSSAS